MLIDASMGSQLHQFPIIFAAFQIKHDTFQQPVPTCDPYKLDRLDVILARSVNLTLPEIKQDSSDSSTITGGGREEFLLRDGEVQTERRQSGRGSSLK